MKEKPDFLKSAAVIGIELLKLAFSTAYILFVEKKPFSSIITFMREDLRIQSSSPSLRQRIACK